MKIYSQRDQRWSNIKLGFGNTTIGTHGCFITSLSMMIEKEPDKTNKVLKRANAFSRDLLISDRAAAALKLKYYGISYTKPDYPCIMEVDFSPSPGKQQHFVVYFPDKDVIWDPWAGTQRSANKYKFVSYRLFKLPEIPAKVEVKNEPVPEVKVEMAQDTNKEIKTPQKSNSEATKEMKYIDFAPGAKTIAFAIVTVLSFFGHQLSQDEVMTTITVIGTAIGNIGMAYGLVMKIIRKLKKQIGIN